MNDPSTLETQRRLSPLKPQAPVRMVTTAEIECWIIDAISHAPSETRYSCTCTLCGHSCFQEPFVSIRYRPVDNGGAISTAERTMRCCIPCAKDYVKVD